MSSTKATIYLVDDDLDFLEALKSLLLSHGYHVQTYSSASSFLEEHDPSIHGCLVLDYAMEEMDGISLQTHLSLNKVKRPIIFLTGRAEILHSVAAMKAGAVDFLVKPFDEAELLQAIKRSLVRDKAQLNEDKASVELSLAFEALTPRERTILELVTAGLINKEIADRLGISERTVKFHRSHLMEKLKADSVVELMNIIHQLEVDPGIRARGEAISL